MFPDLNRLKLFSLVYTNGSVSGAAKALKISQPGVSQQLKKLETELKIPLFTRTQKRLIPTPAAKRLHEKIAPFMDDLHNEITYLRRPLDTPYGQLAIGASPLFGRQLLPTICSHFRFRFPTVTFTVKLADNETLLAGLEDHDLDLALLERRYNRQTPTPGNENRARLFSFKKIFREELLLVCSAGYYRRKIQENTNYETLKKLEFLQTDYTASLADQWFRLNFKKSPVNLDPVLQSNDLEVIINGVRSGMGLAVLPYHLVKKGIASETLTAVPTQHGQLTSELVLTTIKNRKPGLTENAFRSILEKELDKIQPAR